MKKIKVKYTDTYVLYVLVGLLRGRSNAFKRVHEKFPVEWQNDKRVKMRAHRVIGIKGSEQAMMEGTRWDEERRANASVASIAECGEEAESRRTIVHNVHSGPCNGHVHRMAKARSWDVTLSCFSRQWDFAREDLSTECNCTFQSKLNVFINSRQQSI